eukprot:XP_016656250.1 PREDICTED: mitochondrial coenzyme A transporter SLC25A42-like [Acyrthosiphon pisum]
MSYSNRPISHGINGLYKGYVPTILGIVPYAGTSFYTYSYLKTFMKEKHGYDNIITNLTSGSMAGMIGRTTSYPLDTIRRKIQTSNITGENYKSFWATCSTIYKTEGIRHGFYKGMSMNLIKGPIAAAISFITFDLVKKTLNKI